MVQFRSIVVVSLLLLSTAAKCHGAGGKESTILGAVRRKRSWVNHVSTCNTHLSLPSIKMSLSRTRMTFFPWRTVPSSSSPPARQNVRCSFLEEMKSAPNKNLVGSYRFKVRRCTVIVPGSMEPLASRAASFCRRNSTCSESGAVEDAPRIPKRRWHQPKRPWPMLQCLSELPSNHPLNHQ
jgi:hypothetical protein